MPMEEVVEVRRGKKVSAERKFFPGYVLVRWCSTTRPGRWCATPPRSRASWAPGGKPSPIPDHEAERIRNQIAGGRRAPEADDRLHLGRQVRVSDGPFASFSGVVEEVDEAQGPAQGVGVDLRPGDPGRAGVLAGREALAASRAAVVRERRSRRAWTAKPAKEAGSRWRRRSPVTSSCRCRPARPTRRRRSGRRWVSAA